MLFESLLNFEEKLIGLAFGFNFSFFVNSDFKFVSFLIIRSFSEIFGKLSCFIPFNVSSKLNFCKLALK